MTITEFIEARIAEDQAAASDAFYEGQRWAPEEESVIDLACDSEVTFFCDRKRDAVHAARWSPGRVLAQCAALRAVVEVHRAVKPHDLAWTHPPGESITWAKVARLCATCRDSYPCQTICAVAAIWADHPDYPQESR
jgi:hypothetical protein